MGDETFGFMYASIFVILFGSLFTWLDYKTEKAGGMVIGAKIMPIFGAIMLISLALTNFTH